MSGLQDLRVGRVLAEFVLIVVGVLAALAVDEFRTSRAELAQERLYLDGLVRDLDRTERSIRGTAEFHSWVLDHADQILPVLRGEEPVPNDTISFLMSVYQASRSLEPSVVRATYDELISTGSLRLIRDNEVRAAVGYYYEGIEKILWPVTYDQDREPFRTAVRRLFPLAFQRGARACFPGSAQPCRAESSGMALAPLVRSVLARGELPEELTLSMQSMVARNFARSADETRELRLMLQRERGDPQVLDSI